VQRKTAPAAFKASLRGEGTFGATIARFNVVDAQGDVTYPGALPVGKEIVVSAYGHTSWQGALPVGKGVIGADGVRAWVEGSFFLNTTAGRETWQTVKELGPLQEWSYGYSVIDASQNPSELGAWPGAMRILKRVDVIEASPVLAGAGIGTGTDFIKGRDVSREQLEAIRASLIARSVKESFDAATAKMRAADHDRALAEARSLPCVEIDPERIPVQVRGLAESVRNYASTDLGLHPAPSIHHFAPLPAGSSEKAAFRAPWDAIGVQRGREGKIWLKAVLYSPEALVRVTSHEAKHVHQALSLSDDGFRARGIAGLEDEAREYAERVRDEMMGG
jgi:hypothetical protein